MLRSEAREIADHLAPIVGGFQFDDLTLGEDEGGNGEWRARYVNGQNEVIVERWTDVYTYADPEPTTDSEDTTDENTKVSGSSNADTDEG